MGAGLRADAGPPAASAMGGQSQLPLFSKHAHCCEAGIKNKARARAADGGSASAKKDTRNNNRATENLVHLRPVQVAPMQPMHNVPKQ